MCAGVSSIWQRGFFLKFMTSYPCASSLAQHEKSLSLDELTGILAVWEKESFQIFL
jgi:hypothetical protein